MNAEQTMLEQVRELAADAERMVPEMDSHSLIHLAEAQGDGVHMLARLVVEGDEEDDMGELLLALMEYRQSLGHTIDEMNARAGRQELEPHDAKHMGLIVHAVVDWQESGRFMAKVASILTEQLGVEMSAEARAIVNQVMNGESLADTLIADALGDE